MSIVKTSFGKSKDGVEAFLFKLTNSKGMEVGITNYGAILVSIKVPDKAGNFDDVLLGFDQLDDYLKDHPYFGVVVGRHANRIENAEFTLNGKTYHLAKNDGNNHLHGGYEGFDKKFWEAEIININNRESIQLSYFSKDGEENYPGNLEVKVIYTLTEDNELIIDYYAVSDQDTVVNLTNHAYFNLKGHNKGDILDHQLMINADQFTVINNECIPTGEIRNVKGTPMDFTSLRSIREGLLSDDEQIKCGKGYDHNWILNVSGKAAEKAGELYEPESGRLMEFFTTKPGVQFYSGNFIDVVGKAGAKYIKHSGLCLETQYFPNSLKHKHFPSAVLKAGDKYQHTTIYKFSTR
ncbi:MAG TPA: aldose epimerase family protein [Defluviitaleaceae bacterium]|nr:aldose epimerase family protein [Defluviitaleaceae bacterium]